MIDSPDIRAIRLEGELDLDTGRDLGALLSQAVGDTTHRPIVDLSAVTFLDSTALAALVKAAEQMRRQGRVLAIVVQPGAVSDLLDLSVVRDRFEVLSELPPAGPGDVR